MTRWRGNRPGTRASAFAGAVILAVVAAAPGPGKADSPPPAREVPLGSRIPVPVPELSAAERASLRESARILQLFASCAVDRDQTLFAQIVAVPPLPRESSDRQALLRRATAIMERCLTQARQMTANGAVMVGAFAEQLYRRRFAALPALDPSSVPPASNSDEETLQATLEFADCLIDRNAGGVDALLRTRVGSGGEQAAFRLLAPFYVGCVDAGSSLRLNHVALREALADQIYRRAIAAAARLPA